MDDDDDDDDVYWVRTNLGRDNHAIEMPSIMRSSTNKKIAGLYEASFIQRFKR